MRNTRAGSYTSFLLAVFCVAASAPLGSLSSQQPPLRAGDRVRVTTLTDRRFVAIVERLGADSLGLRAADSAVVAVPLASITALEVSRGTRSYTAVGAALGFVTFGLLGYAIGYNIDCGSDCPPAQGGAIAAGVSGISGALIGVAVGASIKAERWHEVSFQRFGTGMTARAEGRVGFAATLRF